MDVCFQLHSVSGKSYRTVSPIARKYPSLSLPLSHPRRYRSVPASSRSISIFLVGVIRLGSKKIRSKKKKKFIKKIPDDTSRHRHDATIISTTINHGARSRSQSHPRPDAAPGLVSLRPPLFRRRRRVCRTPRAWRRVSDARRPRLGSKKDIRTAAKRTFLLFLRSSRAKHKNGFLLRISSRWRFVRRIFR